MMIAFSPLTTCSCTTCEEHIIEDDSSDNFIRSEWTLKSHFPSSMSVHISSEVDKITIIYCVPVILTIRRIHALGTSILNISSLSTTETHIKNIFYHIYEVSLPYSSELEQYISMKDYCLSGNFDISVISISFFQDYSLFITYCSLETISEFCEFFSYCWIEVSIRIARHTEGIHEHILGIIIQYSFSIFIEIMEPIPGYKTRELLFKS